jgi:predicted nucleic acid-binding protein
MSIEEAGAQVADWQTLFTTVYPKPGSLPQAIDAVTRHNLSFWDAMLWSVVKDNGVTVLLSEDLQDGRELGSVWFRNPFIGTDPFLRSRGLSR